MADRVDGGVTLPDTWTSTGYQTVDLRWRRADDELELVAMVREPSGIEGAVRVIGALCAVLELNLIRVTSPATTAAFVPSSSPAFNMHEFFQVATEELGKAGIVLRQEAVLQSESTFVRTGRDTRGTPIWSVFYAYQGELGAVMGVARCDDPWSGAQEEHLLRSILRRLLASDFIFQER